MGEFVRPYRDTASFGRRQEYIAAAELLRRGFDVYMTLVDDQGIDCVIRLDGNRYIDLQIKARSKSAQQGSFFAAMKITARKNLWYMFFAETLGHYWLLPSTDVVALGHQNKNGKHAGKVHLTLPRRESGVVWERFSKYCDDAGFELLRCAR